MIDNHLLLSRASDLPESTYPQVLILRNWDSKGAFDKKLATMAFIRELLQETDYRHKCQQRGGLTEEKFHILLRGKFDSIRVLQLPPHGGESQRNINQLRAFRMRLLQESKDVQNRRRVSKVAFSRSTARPSSIPLASTLQ